MGFPKLSAKVSIIILIFYIHVHMVTEKAMNMHWNKLSTLYILPSSYEIVF